MTQPMLVAHKDTSAPNKWLERTMLAVTALARRPASAAPHRPPLSHTVSR